MEPHLFEKRSGCTGSIYSCPQEKTGTKKQLCAQLKAVYTILETEERGFQWLWMWWTWLLFQLLICWDFQSITSISRVDTGRFSKQEHFQQAAVEWRYKAFFASGVRGRSEQTGLETGAIEASGTQAVYQIIRLDGVSDYCSVVSGLREKILLITDDMFDQPSLVFLVLLPPPTIHFTIF